MLKTYTNNTNEFQVIGNYEKVLITGKKNICEIFVNTFDVENSKYGIVQIVEPGETIEGNLNIDNIAISKNLFKK